LLVLVIKAETVETTLVAVLQVVVAHVADKSRRALTVGVSRRAA
jgi:hypothetical protein